MVIIERPGLPPLRREDPTGRRPGPVLPTIDRIKTPYLGPVLPTIDRIKTPYLGPVLPTIGGVKNPSLVPVLPTSDRIKNPYLGPVLPLNGPLPPKIPVVPQYGGRDFFSPAQVVKRKPWGNR